MKLRERIWLIQLATAVVALLVTISAAPSPDPGHVTATAFAVVELFTSEGCSSCPPADAILSQLAAQARTKGLALYCLAFHVDYWDRLGWRDPFSAAAYSSRQKAYARVKHSQGIYTPQMIVNGTQEFVGSDGSQAQEAVNAALEHPGAVRVSLNLVPEAAGFADAPRAGADTAARVAYSVTGAPTHAVLDVAVVEAGLVSSVAKGENAGRTLREDNVVRAFLTVPLDKAPGGTLAVPVPATVNPAHATVIAYVQDPSTMAVLGATAVAWR